MDNISMFVHSTYYGIHDIAVVNAQEIWDGIKNPNNSQSQAKLAKNMYKIGIPLVNIEKSSLPFQTQATYIQDGVSKGWEYYNSNPYKRFFNKFPNPPQSEVDEKQIRSHITIKMRNIIRDIIKKEIQERRKLQKMGAKLLGFQSVLTNGVFSFEELRIVDNEYPQTFSDEELMFLKAFVLAYMRLICIDELFIDTLTEIGIEEDLVNKFKDISSKVNDDEGNIIIDSPSGTESLGSPYKERVRNKDFAGFLNEERSKAEILEWLKWLYGWFYGLKEKFREN